MKRPAEQKSGPKARTLKPVAASLPVSFSRHHYSHKASVLPTAGVFGDRKPAKKRPEACILRRSSGVRHPSFIRKNKKTCRAWALELRHRPFALEGIPGGGRREPRAGARSESVVLNAAACPSPYSFSRKLVARLGMFSTRPGKKARKIMRDRTKSITCPGGEHISLHAHPHADGTARHLPAQVWEACSHDD